MQVKHLAEPGKFCLINDSLTNHADDDAKLEMRTRATSVLLTTIYTVPGTPSVSNIDFWDMWKMINRVWDQMMCVCVWFIYINPSSLLPIKLTKLFNFCMSQFPQLWKRKLWQKQPPSHEGGFKGLEALWGQALCFLHSKYWTLSALSSSGSVVQEYDSCLGCKRSRVQVLDKPSWTSPVAQQ